MKRHFLSFFKFLLFLSVGLVILYLVYQNQNANWQEQCSLDGIPAEECSLLTKIIDDFRSVNYFWIAIVLVAFMVSNLSRALRWKMLLKPLDCRPRLSNAFFTIILGYFANLGLPRIGEVIRAATLAKYENVAVEKVIGTVMVDRIVDVLCLLTVIGLAFVLEFKTLWGFLDANLAGNGTGSIWQSNLFRLSLVSAFLLAASFYVFRRQIRELSIYRKIIDILKGLWEGILTVRQLEKPWVFLAHSINIWLMYYLMTYLCFFGFGPTASLGPLPGLMVFVFGAFGILIPSPGGMGTYHILVIAALAIYGIDETDAFSFANILFFSVQIGCNVLVGIFALAVLPLINRNYHPKSAPKVGKNLAARGS